MAVNIEGAIRGDDPRIPKVESLNGVTVLGFLNGKVVSIDATLMDLADIATNHLPYIGEDYYVYVWNKESQVYVKTEIYVKGEQGDNISLQKTATHIQWSLGAGAWTNLVALTELKGDTGANLELQKSATHVQWRVAGTSTWSNLILIEDLKVKGDKGDPNTLSIGTVQGGANAGASITGTAPNQTLNLTLPKGDTGSNIELQKTTTHVQWRVQGTTTWNNLILIDDLKVKGDTGANIELQNSTTHVQWRVVGSPTWNNLIPLADLKGAKGDAPVKGVDYFDGKNAVMTIGTITTVASNAQADATVVADGVDAEGKPKFKLNLWLPKGVDGEGAGDMLKSVYDPTGKNADVFGYVDGKVKTDVPVNAKFTDTTYENATTSVSGLMSNTDKSKLDGVEAGANKYVHPAGTNPHGTTKSDVGLGNVDNTSDVNKPVSTAQAAAIALKIDASKFQVVESLPASPVSGTFYFVKE